MLNNMLKLTKYHIKYRNVVIKNNKAYRLQARLKNKNTLMVNESSVFQGVKILK